MKEYFAVMTEIEILLIALGIHLVFLTIWVWRFGKLDKWIQENIDKLEGKKNE